MNPLLIQHAILNGVPCDVLIEEGRFTRIDTTIPAPPGAEVLDASGQILLPSFANLHCHTAMTLLRGFGDDMPLHTWLHDLIWPIEARMTADQIRCGMLFGCHEMIRSGITAVLDMYWQTEACMDAAAESGLRAFICSPAILPPSATPADLVRRMEEELAHAHGLPETIQYAAGIHACYTTRPDLRRTAADFAETHDLLLHAHLSETQKENDDCLATTGKTPTALFDSEGLLSSRFIGAHGVWLRPEDRATLVRCNAAIAHCPKSNCKLASGVFDESAALRDGLRYALGTDGAASNNRYDMFSEMNTAALLHKIHTCNPATASAATLLRVATRGGFEILRLDAGEIAPGKLADCILMNADAPLLAPGHNLISDLVYSATPECVDTTICAGRVLMRHRRIPGEEDVRRQFRKAVADLIPAS